jgi:cell wall-associated NlpC family hydrolase
VRQPDRAAVCAEALSWLGTAYHHHGRLKGVGVDCAQILCAVYEACGLVPHVDPGLYPHDWHLHRSEELYIAWLERCGAREVVQTPGNHAGACGPQVADVALFKFGRTWSHGGIVVDTDTIVHAYLGRGVIVSRLDEEPLDGRAPRYWSLA